MKISWKLRRSQQASCDRRRRNAPPSSSLRQSLSSRFIEARGQEAINKMKGDILMFCKHSTEVPICCSYLDRQVIECQN
jgi:hypothetical protein